MFHLEGNAANYEGSFYIRGLLETVNCFPEKEQLNSTARMLSIYFIFHA